MCLHVEPVSRSKDCVRSRMKIGSVVCLYTPVSPSVPEMEGTYSTGGLLFCLFVFGEPMWPSGKALGCKQKGRGSICFGSPFSSKLWFMDTVL